MSRKISVEIIGDSKSLERSFQRSSHSAKTFEHDLSRTARGAVAASLSFRGLGRAASYASGYLLAGGGLVVGLKEASRAAINHQANEAQLAAAVKNSGASFAAYGKQIDETLKSQRALSGFSEEDTTKSFTRLLRTTKDVGGALKDNALAMEIARGAGIGLNTASNIVNKALAGQTTGLRRLGVELPKGVSGYRALQIAGVKYAGSLTAYAGTAAGAQARLSQAIHETEVSIGTALLPTISKLSGELADWLNKSGNQERIQQDVTKAVQGATAAFKVVADVIRTVDGVTGSFKNTLELILSLGIGVKIARWSGALTGFATSLLGVGSAAATAEGEVAVAAAGMSAAFAPLAVTLGGIIFLFEQMRESAKKSTTIGKITTGSGAGGQNSVVEKSGKYYRVTRTGGRGASAERFHRISAAQAQALTGKQLNTSGMSNDPLHDASGRAAAAAVRGASSSPATAAGLDRLSQIQNAVSAARLAVAKKQSGSQAQLVAALKDQIDYDQKYAAIQETLARKGGKDAKKHAQVMQSLQADEASALDEISSINAKGISAEQKAAKARASAARKAAAAERKRREAAKKAAEERLRIATTFTVPMNLQIAQAKAGTTVSTKDDIAVAKRIKEFAENVIKSNKKKGQAVVDAWNEIAQQMSVIGTQKTRTTGAFHAASLASLTAGLGLTPAARKVAEARLAQAQAHSGYVPTGHGVLGQTISIGAVHVHGVKNVDELLGQIQAKARHAAVQTRGPNAGRNPRVH